MNRRCRTDDDLRSGLRHLMKFGTAIAPPVSRCESRPPRCPENRSTESNPRRQNERPMRVRRGKVEIKTPSEIEAMREVGRLAGETLFAVNDIIRPGITTDEINAFVHADTIAKGAIPAPLGYRGFPKSVCTSVNEVVCHGIPGPRVLKEGDIVNVDVTHIYRGFHGDTSATFYVGEPNEQARRLV